MVTLWKFSLIIPNIYDASLHINTTYKYTLRNDLPWYRIAVDCFLKNQNMFKLRIILWCVMLSLNSLQLILPYVIYIPIFPLLMVFKRPTAVSCWAWLSLDIGCCVHRVHRNMISVRIVARTFTVKTNSKIDSLIDPCVLYLQSAFMLLLLFMHQNRDLLLSCTLSLIMFQYV